MVCVSRAIITQSPNHIQLLADRREAHQYSRRNRRAENRKVLPNHQHKIQRMETIEGWTVNRFSSSEQKKFAASSSEAREGALRWNRARDALRQLLPCCFGRIKHVEIIGNISRSVNPTVHIQHVSMRGEPHEPPWRWRCVYVQGFPCHLRGVQKMQIVQKKIQAPESAKQVNFASSCRKAHSNSRGGAPTSHSLGVLPSHFFQIEDTECIQQLSWRGGLDTCFWLPIHIVEDVSSPDIAAE